MPWDNAKKTMRLLQQLNVLPSPWALSHHGRRDHFRETKARELGGRVTGVLSDCWWAPFSPNSSKTRWTHPFALTDLVQVQTAFTSLLGAEPQRYLHPEPVRGRGVLPISSARPWGPRHGAHHAPDPGVRREPETAPAVALPRQNGFSPSLPSSGSPCGEPASPATRTNSQLVLNHQPMDAPIPLDGPTFLDPPLHPACGQACS